MELTRIQLNRATLARQFLLERQRTPALAVIERLFAMQAQLARPPFIGLWSRVEGFERQELARLLMKKQAVRGTLLRGTLHLLSTKDFLAFRALFSPMLEKMITSILRERAKGLEVERVVEQATKYLSEGPRTFEEIRAHLAALNPKADDRAMGLAVRCAVQLIQVPIEAPWSFPGNAQFGLAREWIGKAASTQVDPSALVLRYLAAFGPASVADMQTWSGLKALEATFEALGPKLQAFIDPRGKKVFDLPKAPRPDPKTPAPVRFLPDYDNLLLGHADRTRVIADAHLKRIATKNLMILPSFLVDGFVAGTWKIERTKTAAALKLQAFEPVPKKTKDALLLEGAALLKFVEPDAAKQAVQLA